MKIIAPDYMERFHCIADRCEHSCCQGWEVDIDEMSLQRFLAMKDISPFIDTQGDPHFRLTAEECCPFLTEKKLCRLILDYGEDILCDICRDHPRFRNYWTNRTELGLGLVCEEAARLILSRKNPMKLVVLEEDGEKEPVSEQESSLLELRDRLLEGIRQTGPEARLMEYLIYRHLPDALYDDRLDARIAFIREAYQEITQAWSRTDGSLEALAECARVWSYDVEYDEEETEKRLSRLEDDLLSESENS